MMSPLEGRRDYNEREVEAARRVLAELAYLLDEYREGIVLVGGWVPFFAIPNPQMPHEGTKDVDLALDARLLRADGDETIEEILMNALYQQDKEKRFRWTRDVEVDGKHIPVVVDFLTGERSNFTNGRLQRIQDIDVSTMRGCDAAFLNPVEMSLKTRGPEGNMLRTKIQVASLPQFLAMKGLAFRNRDEMARRDDRFTADARKDAYDIYFVIKNYDGGFKALAELVRPHLGEPVLQEALNNIAERWKSVGSRGPTLVAQREEDEEERARLRQDAFGQVRAFLEEVGAVETE